MKKPVTRTVRVDTLARVEGEAALATQGVTVRCLRRPDGSLAEADDEPDLVAVVARSY